MSTQRFTPEFKAEAVRQVIERGYSVADIAERLGVSTHSLYKWVKAVTPDKTEKQTSELLEAKSETLRLRAQACSACGCRSSCIYRFRIGNASIPRSFRAAEVKSLADQLFDGPDGHSLDRLASSQTLPDTHINKQRADARCGRGKT